MSGAQAILWDMDGVLADTGAFHYLAWEATLREYGISFTEEAFRTTFGMNNEGILRTLLGRCPEPELVEEVSNIKEGRFREAIRGRVGAAPGVLAWLDMLRQAGLSQAIASSAPAANIEVLIKELNLGLYFEVAVSGVGMPSKPDAALFLHAAELLGVDPSECAVVEDAIAGVAAAKRAGMRCLAITTTNPAHYLREADLIIDGFDKDSWTRFQRLMAIEGSPGLA